MTDNQILHHQDQMDAMRADFYRWFNAQQGSLINSPRQKFIAETYAWRAWAESNKRTKTLKTQET